LSQEDAKRLVHKRGIVLGAAWVFFCWTFFRGDLLGDFLRKFAADFAVEQSQSLLGDDALLAAVTIKHIWGIELGEEALVLIVGMEEIEAAAGRLGIGGGDGWPANFGIEASRQMKESIAYRFGFESLGVFVPEGFVFGIEFPSGVVW